MRNEIRFEKEEQLTLEEYIPVASDLLIRIAAAAEGVDEIREIFTLSELRRVLTDMSDGLDGEFEFRETGSGRYQVIYAPYEAIDETEFEDAYEVPAPVEPLYGNQKFIWLNMEKVLAAFRDPKFSRSSRLFYFHLGSLMHSDASFAVSHHIKFEKIVESCREQKEIFSGHHQTTVMRAMANLEDVGLAKWNPETRAFEVLHITPYDPKRTI